MIRGCGEGQFKKTGQAVGHAFPKAARPRYRCSNARAPRSKCPFRTSTTPWIFAGVIAPFATMASERMGISYSMPSNILSRFEVVAALAPPTPASNSVSALLRRSESISRPNHVAFRSRTGEFLVKGVSGAGFGSGAPSSASKGLYYKRTEEQYITKATIIFLFTLSELKRKRVPQKSLKQC